MAEDLPWPEPGVIVRATLDNGKVIETWHNGVVWWAVMGTKRRVVKWDPLPPAPPKPPSKPVEGPRWRG